MVRTPWAGGGRLGKGEVGLIGVGERGVGLVREGGGSLDPTAAQLREEIAIGLFKNIQIMERLIRNLN